MEKRQEGDGEAVKEVKERKAREVGIWTAATNIEDHESRIKAKAKDLQTTAAAHLSSAPTTATLTEPKGTLEQKSAAKIQNETREKPTSEFQTPDDRIAIKASRIIASGSSDQVQGRLGDLEKRVTSKIRGADTSGSATAELQQLEDRVAAKVNNTSLAKTRGSASTRKSIPSGLQQLKDQIARKVTRHSSPTDPERLVEEKEEVDDEVNDEENQVNANISDGPHEFVVAATVVNEPNEETLAENEELYMRRARDAIIRHSVVATRAENVPNTSLWWTIVLCVALVVIVVMASVCGTGNCSPNNSEAIRQEGIRTFLEDMSYMDGWEEGSSAVRRASDFVINDPRKWKVADSRGRILQRYVLALVYYGYEEYTSIYDGEKWLLFDEECQWSGIECLASSGVVTSIKLFHENYERDATIPSDLGLMTQLTNLQIIHTRFGPTVPLEWRFLTNLQNLHLHDNRLSTGIPTLLGALTQLTSLTFTRQGIVNGTIPDDLVLSRTMESLSLGNNNFVGTIPSSLASLPELTSLRLLNNAFEGEIPKFIQEWTGLRELGIDALSREYSFFSSLSNLTEISGDIGSTLPTELGDWFPELKTLSNYGGRLIGTIPSAISKLTKLEMFNVLFNDLSGSLPQEMFEQCTNLKDLHLAQNKRLGGSIPSTIGFATSLKWVTADGCDFGGSLPTEIGLLSNMTFFSLPENQLSGPIPTEIGGMETMIFFKMNGNALTGTVPTEILQLSSLSTVELQDNELVGTAPQCSVEGNFFLADKLKYDCGEVDCPCCEGCGNEFPPGLFD